MKSVKSPDGVNFLMKNIWLRHQAGLTPCPRNVFISERLTPIQEGQGQVRDEKKYIELDNETIINTLKYSKRVKRLMKKMWLHDQKRSKQKPDNVYMVSFSPSTPEELAQARGMHDVIDDEIFKLCSIVD